LGLIWFDIEGKGSFSLIQIGRLLKRIMISVFEYFGLTMETQDIIVLFKFT